MKKLAPFIIFISLVAFMNAQETQTTESSTAQSSNTNIESPQALCFDPVTGNLLPSGTPYLVTGTPGDGNPDRLQFLVSLRAPKGVLDFEEFMEASSTILNIDIIRDGEVGMLDDPVFLDPDYSESLGNTPNKVLRDDMDWDYLDLRGEINLSFDISQMQRLGYRAALMVDGNEISTFHTEITAGSPELTIHSKITSGGLIMSGLTFFSEVSGRTGLAFEPGNNMLKGRGPLTYDKFEIDTGDENCTITTKKKSGDWRVEVVLPDDLFLTEPSLDGVRFFPPPLEVVTMIEPKISESATIRCPRGMPPVMPLPRLIHFFAAFFSFHGGEIPVAGQETPNELKRDRGGLVMTDWLPGTGNIIATRNYKRVGTRDNVTCEEDTELVLKWPGNEISVPVCHQLGNGESQTIYVNQSGVQDHLAHGDYEGECLFPVCHQLGNCESETINVAENAVPTHIAHGDYEGECYDCCFSGFLELETYTRFCNTVVDGIGTFYIADDGDGLLKITVDSGGSLCEVRSSSGDTVGDPNISFEAAQACLEVLMCIADGLELVENCD